MIVWSTRWFQWVLKNRNYWGVPGKTWNARISEVSAVKFRVNRSQFRNTYLKDDCIDIVESSYLVWMYFINDNKNRGQTYAHISSASNRGAKSGVGRELARNVRGFICVRYQYFKLIEEWRDSGYSVVQHSYGAACNLQNEICKKLVVSHCISKYWLCFWWHACTHSERW